MTIKELAQQQGITVQAVYKRIKAAGIDINTLKDAETGRFTEEGEKIVLSLISTKRPPESAENTYKQEIERLRLTNEQLLKQIEMLRQNCDDLRNALNAAQVLQRETLLRIPPALPPTDEEKQKRRTWWDRIRGRA